MIRAARYECTDTENIRMYVMPKLEVAKECGVSVAAFNGPWNLTWIAVQTDRITKIRLIYGRAVYGFSMHIVIKRSKYSMNMKLLQVISVIPMNSMP